MASLATWVAAPSDVARPTRISATGARAASERLRGQIEGLRLDRGPTGERFATYVDTHGDFQAVEWLDVTAGDAAIWDLLLHLFRDDGTDPNFAVVYTSFEMPGSLYYAPLANDVSGIGDDIGDDYDHSKGRRLEGYVFMNDVPFWLEQPEQMEMLFNQEMGHRFGVFVHADLGEGPTDELLGRNGDHWSYFMHTDSSPMEGNTWIDNGDGSFTTRTADNAVVFHPLDLYLMGLLPPEDVERTFIIRNVVAPGVDCFGRPVSRGSVPQFCGPQMTIHGERLEIGVDEIVAVEGPREPAWPDAPDRFEVAFVLLISNAEEARDLELLRAFDDLVRRAVQAFHLGTDGRAELVVVTGRPGGLDDLDDVDEGCGCRVGGRQVRNPSLAVMLIAMVLVAGRKRR